MGIRSCNIKCCSNILSNKVIDDFGYICDGCFNRLEITLKEKLGDKNSSIEFDKLTEQFLKTPIEKDIKLEEFLKQL